MTITTSAFQHNETIPTDYTCQGRNVNPPLTFSEIPPDTGSLVLIMDDPDAPGDEPFVHWLLYNMSPASLQILENAAPVTGSVGSNSFGRLGYGGPCPPSGRHRYFFKLYALKSRLDLPEGASKQKLESAMKDQVIESAELIGQYEKSSVDK